jgi:hypothetical protein
MQNPTFYRERAQIAEKLAESCRDQTAKQGLQRAAERWRELARLAGPKEPNEAASKTKKL